MNSKSNNNTGIKWVNYAQAFSIFVTAIIAIYSLFVSKNNEFENSKQQIQLESFESKILEIGKVISTNLTVNNVIDGDTVTTNTPILAGHLNNIPANFKLYGAVKIDNQYNIMQNPIDVEANGRWEYQFNIGSGLGNCKIIFFLVDEDAHNQLKTQTSQGNWEIKELSEGIIIVKSIAIYKT